MEMLPLSSALTERGILLRGSFLGSPGVPWWIMGGFWWLWKREEWNNVVTIKHRAPCACWQPALPVCSSLPFPLPNISITWSVSKEKGLFPGLSYLLRLCQGGSTWSRLGQGDPALLHVKYLQAGVFSPNFTPLPGVQALGQTPEKLAPAPGASCSRRVQGAFTGLESHRWALFWLKRAFYWPLIGLQPRKWYLLVLSCKNQTPNTKKKTSQKAWAKAKEASWSKNSTDFHVQP